MKKNKRISEERIKKANIIIEFKKIAHDIYAEEDSLLLKLEQVMGIKRNEEIDEIELIHDLRVNLRRLISLLYFYRPVLKKNERKAMTKELNILLKSFGSQRTYDILQKFVVKFADSKIEDEEKGEVVKNALLNLINETLGKDDPGENNSKKLRPNDSKFKSIYESVYQRLMESEDNLFKIKKSAEIKDLHDFKGKRIQELKKTIKEKEREVNLPKVKEIHALRILGKNIFYTVNTFNEEFSGVHKDFLNHLRRIQDIAGRIHDADVNLSMMKDLLKGKEKNSIAQDFMDFLEREKKEKIAEFKEIIEEKFDE